MAGRYLAIAFQLKFYFQVITFAKGVPFRNES